RYGIHIPDRKGLTSEKKIEVMPSPATVYISLSQHIGAPSEPIVNIGDKVKKGTLIGKENGAVSANIFSSVSGTVEDIVDIVNGMGVKQKYIKIASNGLNEEEFLPKLEDFSSTSLIKRIREAGIVGLGGAGFPTAIKLSPKTQLDTLIINGAECEPYLNCDYRLMLERADDIYKGIKYTAKALNISKILVGIEANKPKAIEIFSKFTDLDVVVLKKQYPMGSEKHLIYCTTGRKVPCGKMPFDVGCCVQNIKTVIAIYEAIELNKPLTDIVMTVSGLAIHDPKNIKVNIGTSFEDIITFCSGFKKDPEKIICGGPMMGRALINLNYYTVKTSSGLLLLTKEETNTEQPTNCINCGKCAKNCPMRLMPMYIETYTLSGDYKSAEKYGAMNCIECGSCAFNCPAKRPLVQNIQFAKAKIKEMKANVK
ncbi:MAG: electron transport complex subunit RsxC, partial [Firmicutes bacterium]|nr:electron transport complex subunit RsxC [Candidatus Caballimonas caccae]